MNAENKPDSDDDSDEDSDSSSDDEVSSVKLWFLGYEIYSKY